MEEVPSVPDLTVFVPSRGRPGQVTDFATQFESTCTGSTKLVLVVDEDDPDACRYTLKTANRWETWIAPTTRRGMVGALNAAYRHYDSAGQLGLAVGFMGDDHRPRTHGWDSQYIATLRMLKNGFVYGNDLFQREIMPTQVAFTTDIARALGYMSPPELDHLCVDVVWRELGKRLNNIVYLESVIVEHMHPLAGKAKNDKQYKAVNSILMARHDNNAYLEYMEQGRFEEDLGRIKMMIETGYIEPR